MGVEKTFFILQGGSTHVIKGFLGKRGSAAAL